MLAEAAARVGVDANEAMEFLQSGEGEMEIEGALLILRKMGINSIPNFIVGAQHILSGAVHSSELIKLFRQIERTGKGAPDSAFAAVLGIGAGLGIPIFFVTQETRDKERIEEIRELNRATLKATGEQMSEEEIKELRPNRYLDRREFKDDD